jgi:hypothetical protein
MLLRSKLPAFATLYRLAPVDTLDPTSMASQYAIAMALHDAAASTDNSTNAAIGSVVLQLLFMHLHRSDLQPMFNQPVPWLFLPSNDHGTPLSTD